MNCFQLKRLVLLSLSIGIGIQPSVAFSNPPVPSVQKKAAATSSPSSSQTAARRTAKRQISTASNVRIVDVALDTAGTLHGGVYNVSGSPLVNAKVVLRKEGRDIGSSTTTKDGKFRFTKVKSGVYQLQTASGVAVCRLWTHRAAPPSAANRILVVEGATVARGQHPISELFTSDPVLIGSIVAAAVVVPVVIHENRDDDDTGS